MEGKITSLRGDWSSEVREKLSFKELAVCVSDKNSWAV